MSAPLQELLNALDGMIASGRPGRWVNADGNGIDYSHLPVEDGIAEARRLRFEVAERIAGRGTMASRLGDAIQRLRAAGELP